MQIYKYFKNKAKQLKTFIPKLWHNFYICPFHTVIYPNHKKMKKLILLGSCIIGGILVSAFTFSHGTSSAISPSGLSQGTKVPFYAVFDTDSFYCDPAEAKHQGKVHNRFNTLHMKEKGPENIIVHFKSKKYPGPRGKMENDYVHFDILFNDAMIGPREDTHLSLDWKGKKYHVKNKDCKLNITSLTWKEDKMHFVFSADFEAKVMAGGTDTITHIFKGKIVDELVKAKGHTHSAGHK